jgi:hypothetical protein
MVRSLLLVAAPAVLLAACIIPPGDREQIRDLVQDRAEALTGGDTAALYRLHDLDFRTICPLERFATRHPEAAPMRTIRSIEIRGQRAWATLGRSDDDEERIAFVKDAGRWYLYEDAEACLQRSWPLVPRSTAAWAPGSEGGAGNEEPLGGAAVADG